MRKIFSVLRIAVWLLLFQSSLVFAATTTPNLTLNTPTLGTTGWNTLLNANFDTLDALFGSAAGHDHTGVAGEGPKIPLGSAVSGTLLVANGGTGGTSFSNKSIVFSNGSIFTQDNTNFCWDDTNNRLGLGTCSPSDIFHLVAPNKQIVLLSNATTAYTAYTIGRTSEDGAFAVSDSSGADFSNFSTAGDVILRTTTEDLILTTVTASGAIRFGTGNLDTQKMMLSSGGTLLVGHSVTTGANAGSIIVNSSVVGGGTPIGYLFLNGSGTTSANLGLTTVATDDITYGVPGVGDFHSFAFAGSERLRLVQENSGVGILFVGESSAAHGAPNANSAIMYVDDSGGGKTRLMVRFNTGSAVTLGQEP